MDRDQMVKVVSVGFMVLALLMGAAIAAFAQDTSLGQFCWNMTPFDDTIIVDASWFEAPPGLTAWYAFSVAWHGLTFYTLNGGGTATNDPASGLLTADLLLRNASTFFGGHTMCRLSMSLDFTLEGPWAMLCHGLTPPTQGGTPYLVQGTTTRIACDSPQALGIASAFSSQRSASMAGMLAGR